MRISDVLQRVGGNTVHGHQTLFLNGSIEKHEKDGFFRLYYDESNKREYFIVSVEDVIDEIHEWNEGEIASSRFVGQKRFKVPVKYGSTLELVKVEVHRLGETLAGHDSASDAATLGVCRGATSCSSTCCTQGNSGGNCYCDSCCIS